MCDTAEISVHFDSRSRRQRRHAARFMQALAIKLLQALSDMAAVGLMHCDVKTDNVAVLINRNTGELEDIKVRKDLPPAPPCWLACLPSCPPACISTRTLPSLPALPAVVRVTRLLLLLTSCCT